MSPFRRRWRGHGRRRAKKKPAAVVVQIGSQRVSSVICTKAKELLSNGIIGTLTLVEGSLGRNDPTGAWEYPPPPDLSPEKSRLGHLAKARYPKFLSIPISSRAGAAGGNTAPALPATCSSIWSAA